MALILLWVSLAAVQDWRCRKVSHLLVLVGLGSGLAVRIAGFSRGTWAEVLAVFLLLVFGWQMKWIGGADVKGTLAIALVSVPMAAWAWGGVLACDGIAKRSTTGNLDRFPGYVGFAAGIAAYGLITYLGEW